MLFDCVVLECLMHMFILWDAISAFKAIFPFLLLFSPLLLCPSVTLLNQFSCLAGFYI